MATLYLNNDAVVKFTNKLEQLNHTTLPNLVKDTLDFAAKYTKQNTMPKQAKRDFSIRQQNFFTATSHIDYVKKTHNIGEMQSAMGFDPAQQKALTPANNFSVKDLQEQEYGGMIGGKTFIPLPAARNGNSNMGLVINKYRLSEIRKKSFVFADKAPGKNNKEKWIKSCVFVGVGGFVVGTGIDRTFLFQVDSISKVKVGASQPGSIFRNRAYARTITVIKATKLYSVQYHRKVEIKETDFMAKASEVTTAKLEQFYISFAKQRIERDLKI